MGKNLTDDAEKRVADAVSPHFLGDEQKALVNLADITVGESVISYQADIDGLQEQLDDLHSAAGAGLVGILDAGNYFASNTVEGALAELGAGGGGGGGSFDPTANQTITGVWDFDNPVTIDGTDITDSTVVFDSGAVLDMSGTTAARSHVFPDKSGTVAHTSDIPAQVNLTAGTNVAIGGTYPNLTISAAGGGGGSSQWVGVGVNDIVYTAGRVGIGTGSPTQRLSVSGNMTLSGTLNGRDVSTDGSKLDGIATGATANLGTVTSVAAVGGTGIFFSGGPVTSAGTLTATLSSNLQAWSGIAPASKLDSGGVLGLNNGGTGYALGTSGSDAIMFYDASAGGVRYLYPGTGITITGTTISATGNAVTYVNGQTGNVTITYASVGAEQAFSKGSLIAGSNVSLSGTLTKRLVGSGDVTISATGGGGGSGTVTSVGLMAPTGLTVSGSPVTGAGSLGLSWSGGYQAYTSSEASKLASIAAGAQVNAVNNVNGQTGNVTLTHTSVGAEQAFSKGSLIAGTNVSLSGTLANRLVGSGDVTINATGGGGSGTVTYVNINSSTGITWSGGPITTTGTLTATLGANLQAWNSVATSAKQNTIGGSGITNVVLGTGAPSGLVSGTLYLRY